MNMGDASPSSGATADAAAVPSYSDLFPELNSMLVGANTSTASSRSTTSKAPSIVTKGPAVGAVRSSTATTVFRIGVEEQRLLAGTKYGDDVKQRRVVDDIQAEMGVTIDMSYTKDNTLCVVITGKGQKPVNEAKAQLLRRLQKQAEVELAGIPPEHFPAIIGRGGETLRNIQTETATRVKIPAADDIAGVIRITGPAEGCGKARTMIQCISDVEANRDRVKLPVLKAYHPLVVGHKHETVKRIAKETGASIHVPPSSKATDEITITGEKAGVQQAAAELTAIYERLKLTCGELTANIKKAQHRFVIGPRGSYLDEIMKEFGVVVEIPPADVESDTITLRGPQDKLVLALTKVFERAASMTADELQVPGWLHRHMIGRKGAVLTELTKPFAGASVNFDEDAGLVRIEGPPAEVQAVKQILGAKRDELLATVATAELSVPSEFHSRIIGKQGAIVGKIKESTGAQINFPKGEAARSGDKKDVIRVEGPKEGVKQACAQINAVVEKIKNHTELKYKVEDRLHSLIIGAKGAQIKKMISECGDVSLDVPKPSAGAGEITVSGDKSSVAKAKAYLDRLVKQLREVNFVLEVPVYKPYHGTVIGKGGATVNKIKEETGTRIDIPSAGDASDVITVTGVRAKCEEARKRILKIQDDIATIVDGKVRFPDDLEFKCRACVIPAVRQACGGVLVTAGKGELAMRGPEEDVARAKAALSAVVAKHAASKLVETLDDVPKKHFRQIAGKQRAGVEQIESDTGALVFVPPQQGAAADARVTVLGTADEVAAARDAVAKRVSELEDQVKETVDVAKKYQKEMLAKRSKFLNDLKASTGVSVTLPKDGGESVTLEGSRVRMPEAVAAVKQFVQDVDDRVWVKVQIPSRDHRVFFVNGGAEIRRITDEHNVSIKIPDRRKAAAANKASPKAAPKAAAAKNGAAAPKDGSGADDANGVNGEPAAPADAAADAADAKAAAADAKAAAKEAREAKAKAADTITITGTPANCAAAEAALRELLPVEETVQIDPALHRFVIGKGGEAVRKFMAEHNVNVHFGKPDDANVRVRGDRAKVPAAVAALKERVGELEKVKADLEAKSFKVELTIDPRFHVRLIGKQGANVNRLREEHGVEINFPDRRPGKKAAKSETAAKLVTVTGYEAAATKAAGEIMAMVEELQSLVSISIDVHPGCHRKIIGRGGSSIKALQSKHKVRVFMPREDGGPVRIEGAEKAALDCKDDILELEEEWRQEAEDYEDDASEYVRPSRYDAPPEPKQPKGGEFKVAGAPWEKPPNTSDSSSFPGLGGPGAAKAAAAAANGGGVWSRPSGGR